MGVLTNYSKRSQECPLEIRDDCPSIKNECKAADTLSTKRMYVVRGPPNEPLFNFELRTNNNYVRSWMHTKVDVMCTHR